MASASKLSIFLLIRSLELGGAERQLVELASSLRRCGQKVQVGVFYSQGPLAVELQQVGVPIIGLAKRGRWDLIGFFWRLARVLKQVRPDILYCFLGGANLAGAVVRPFVPNLKLAWSIRASDVDLNRYDWTHRLGYRLERLGSRLPDLIIANSMTGRAFALRNGFPADRIKLVFNGIDTGRFRPDPALRCSQRKTWGLSEGDIAVGMLARLDPMKDHQTFLRAAALLVEQRPNIRFLCIGGGSLREPLEQFARELGISERVIFTGEGEAVACLNALDLVCSSSISEGFPNSLAEAMACGRPCVATNAGDSAEIIGDTGSIVPIRDPGALARAILDEIDARSGSRSDSARQRVIDKFSVEAMATNTLNAFMNVVNEHR